MSAPSSHPTTTSPAPRLARFAAAGPVMRSTSGRLVTVPVREALVARDRAAERDLRTRDYKIAA